MENAVCSWKYFHYNWMNLIKTHASQQLDSNKLSKFVLLLISVASSVCVYVYVCIYIYSINFQLCLLDNFYKMRLTGKYENRFQKNWRLVVK